MPAAVTSSLYPHRDPEGAARMILLYAQDADMRDPDAFGEIIWPAAYDEPPADTVCLVTVQEMRAWYWEEEDWDIETYGRYVLMIPKTGN